MELHKVPLLMSNRLFRGLSRGQVEEFASHLVEEEFPTDEFIIRESQPADRVYVLVEGKATVQKHLSASGAEEVEIAVLEAGDFFGEMSFFSEASERSASIRALSPVRAYSLRREEFTILLAEHPEVMRNILSNIVIQLQASNLRFIERLRREKGELEEKVVERTRELSRMSARLERELAIAQNIQRNLLPEKAVNFPRVSIRTEYLPCEELSGDIIGVLPVDEWRIALYGGDVCGHGIYAAVVMSYVKKLIETSVKRVLLNHHFVVKPPGAVLSSINRSFISEISLGDPEIYLTLFLAVLDTRSLRFEYSSAGIHVPPLVLSGGRMKELFAGSDIPIGVVSDHDYVTESAVFRPGDALFFVSDGVVEARRGEEAFGIERLKREALPILTGPSEPDLDAIVARVKSFLGGQKPEDDMCFLLMRVGDPQG